VSETIVLLHAVVLAVSVIETGREIASVIGIAEAAVLWVLIGTFLAEARRRKAPKQPAEEPARRQHGRRSETLATFGREMEIGTGTFVTAIGRGRGSVTVTVTETSATETETEIASVTETAITGIATATEIASGTGRGHEIAADVTPAVEEDTRPLHASKTPTATSPAEAIPQGGIGVGAAVEVETETAMEEE
jgi:hypothetical protein